MTAVVTLTAVLTLTAVITSTAGSVISMSQTNNTDKSILTIAANGMNGWSHNSVTGLKIQLNSNGKEKLISNYSITSSGYATAHNWYGYVVTKKNHSPDKILCVMRGYNPVKQFSFTSSTVNYS